MLVIIAFSLISGFTYAYGIDKNNLPRLRILHLMPFTGLLPNQYKTCRAISELVIDLVNKRSDILPDYYVEPQFMDDANGPLLVRRFLEFENQFEGNKMTENNTLSYKAPVIVGPISNCELIASFAANLGFTEVAPCTQDFLLNRFRYPNLYLTRPIGFQAFIARLRFIIDVGKWNYFALLSSASQDTMPSRVIQSMAFSMGMQVYFDAIVDFDDESALNLKKSDARIILISVPGIVNYRILCQCYKFGITGSRYVFILPGSLFAEPNTLPQEIYPGCTRDIMAIQYRSAVMVTSQVSSDEISVKSTLGYSLKEMDVMLDQYTSMLRHPDYAMRHLCHDNILQTLLLLNQSDSQLRTQGLSLKNITNIPHYIGKVVNQTALNVKYVGLRKSGLSGYTEKGDMLASKWAITQWSVAEGQRNIYMVVQTVTERQSLNGGIETFSSIQTSPARWLTANGRPPRDRALTRYIAKDVDMSFKFAVYVICAVLITLKILAVLKQFLKPNRKASAFRRMRFSIAIQFIGLAIVDISAVLFVLETELGTTCQLYILRISTIVVGLGISHASMIARVTVVNSVVDTLRFKNDFSKTTYSLSMISDAKGTLRTIRTSGVRSVQQMRTIVLSEKFNIEMLSKKVFRRMEIKAAIATGLCAVLSGLFIVAWALFDKPNCVKLELPPGHVYLDTEDTFLYTSAIHCFSKNDTEWMLSALAANVFALVFGCSYARKLCRNVKFMVHHEDFKYILFAMVNSIIIMLASCLVLLAFPDSPITQRIIVSASAILISASTASICYHLQLKKQPLMRWSSP